MPPQKKRQRETTLANLPRNILEKIHTDLYKRSLTDSREFARSFKRAREAIPLTRPNRVTNAEKKIQLPPGVRLPGPAEVRELKQRLLFVTKLLRELQRDAKSANYMTRKQRYSAFANALRHILETNPGLDTIEKRHLGTDYTLDTGELVTSMREFRDSGYGDEAQERIQLYIKSSKNVLPFTLYLAIESTDFEISHFREAVVTVDIGHWEWYMLGDNDTPRRINVPLSVHRIRVNRQTGIVCPSTSIETIRHQQDTIDLVRLIRLMKSTDPNVRWRHYLPSYIKNSSVFHRVVQMHALQGRTRNRNNNSNTYVSNSNRN